MGQDPPGLAELLALRRHLANGLLAEALGSEGASLQFGGELRLAAQVIVFVGGVGVLEVVEDGSDLDDFNFIVELIAIGLGCHILKFAAKIFGLCERAAELLAFDEGALEAVARALDRDDLRRLHVHLEDRVERILRLRCDTLLK